MAYAEPIYQLISNTLAYQVLDLARWAPSGENTQPWKFDIQGDDEFIVSCDVSDHKPGHDVDGYVRHLSVGALLENIAIAAKRFGSVAEIQALFSEDRAIPCFKVFLRRGAGTGHSLSDFIQERCVHRGRLSTRLLSVQEKSTLAACLEAGYSIIWFEGAREKWKIIRLLLKASQLRLTMPEARKTHLSVIEWDSKFSEDRIPDAALGAGKLTRIIMRWALQSWPRIQFLNRYLAGTWMPRIEMDLLPGAFCGAHFLLCAPKRPETVEECLTAGRIMQRVWLTATSLGLQMQPEFAPIIYNRYASKEIRFSAEPSCLALADEIRDEFAVSFGGEVSVKAFFLGRLGAGNAPSARSLRKTVESKLLL